jgi:hypothetical protein
MGISCSLTQLEIEREHDRVPTMSDLSQGQDPDPSRSRKKRRAHALNRLMHLLCVIAEVEVDDTHLEHNMNLYAKGPYLVR